MKTNYANILFTLCTFTASFTFSSCKKECTGESNRTYPLTGFTCIDAGDQHRFSIARGDHFSIQASGCTDDINDLSVEVVNQQLQIRYPEFKRWHDGVTFFITMPVLKGAKFSGQSKATITGFADTTNKVFDLSGQSACSYYGHSATDVISVSGQSEFILQGVALNLQINVSGQSRYSGYGVLVNQSTNVLASGQSEAYVYTNGAFTASASGQSSIYYKGSPSFKNFSCSGQSKISWQP